MLKSRSAGRLIQFVAAVFYRLAQHWKLARHPAVQRVLQEKTEAIVVALQSSKLVLGNPTLARSVTHIVLKFVRSHSRRLPAIEGPCRSHSSWGPCQSQVAWSMTVAIAYMAFRSIRATSFDYWQLAISVPPSVPNRPGLASAAISTG
jgi:hypothetical protein